MFVSGTLKVDKTNVPHSCLKSWVSCLYGQLDPLFYPIFFLRRAQFSASIHFLDDQIHRTLDIYIYIYDLFIFIFCIYWRRISPLVLHSLMMAIRIIRRVCLWVPQIQEFILHGVPPAKANGFCGTRRHAEIYQTFCSCKLFSIKKHRDESPCSD